MDPKMKQLEEKIVRYGDLDVQVKALEKEKEPLNKEIKAEMKALELDGLEVEGYTATYSVQQRTSMDEQKLLAYLEANGLEEAIETVRRPNASVVEDLIHQGKIRSEEIAHCIIVKPVEVLSVKPKKAKSEKKEATPKTESKTTFSRTPLGDTF